MKTRYIAALAATACLASAAPAQDFSGLRVEGRVGWESGRVSTVFTPEVQIPENPPVTVSGSESGVSYGAEIGYDARLGDAGSGSGAGAVVVGVYGGADFSDLERCGEAFGDDLGCVGTGRSLTAGVRAGAAVSPTLLVYAKGGYSNGRVEYSYDSDVDEEDALEADVAERSRSQDGYHVGAGAEIAFGGNLYGKLEYVFTDYGSVRFAGVEDGEPDASVDARRHQVVAGIGLRF